MSNPYAQSLHLLISTRKTHQSVKVTGGKLVFLRVLALSPCRSTSVIERKQLAVRPRGLSPRWQTDWCWQTILTDCFAGVFPVTLGAQRSKQLRSVVSAGTERLEMEGAAGSCGLEQCSARTWPQLPAIFWFILPELTGLDLNPRFFLPLRWKCASWGSHGVGALNKKKVTSLSS